MRAMETQTLPSFTPAQLARAHELLASHVATMMGRKFEEGDWYNVYCKAKGIPVAGWSNLSIDVIHGNLGVEHKMLCVRSDKHIKEYCGEILMHPAGTRSIRIPEEKDPTKAARNVLRQYAELIQQRRQMVQILDNYHHGLIDREQAVQRVAQLYNISKAAAMRLVPSTRSPVMESYEPRDPDIRTGWLLWQDSLVEFLYFEQPTTIPNPNDYVAEWKESGGGRRKTSVTLWVYHKATSEKHFSITTSAGAKIQPYFKVPLPSDPNLVYLRVQGEPYGDGYVRIWITDITARLLKTILGDLDGEKVSQAILALANEIDSLPEDTQQVLHQDKGVPLVIRTDAYNALKTRFSGVSDEHMMQNFVRVLQTYSRFTSKQGC